MRKFLYSSFLMSTCPVLASWKCLPSSSDLQTTNPTHTHELIIRECANGVRRPLFRSICSSDSRHQPCMTPDQLPCQKCRYAQAFYSYPTKILLPAPQWRTQGPKLACKCDTKQISLPSLVACFKRTAMVMIGNIGRDIYISTLCTPRNLRRGILELANKTSRRQTESRDEDRLVCMAAYGLDVRLPRMCRLAARSRLS